MLAGINLLLIFEILYIVTIVSAILIIIIENRNPQKSISWILAILFIPFLGKEELYLAYIAEYQRA